MVSRAIVTRGSRPWRPAGMLGAIRVTLARTKTQLPGRLIGASRRTRVPGIVPSNRPRVPVPWRPWILVPRGGASAVTRHRGGPGRARWPLHMSAMAGIPQVGIRLIPVPHHVLGLNGDGQGVLGTGDQFVVGEHLDPGQVAVVGAQGLAQFLLGHVVVSYTHLRAHETDSYLVCRLLLE